jgi:hypothetical protein
MVDLRGAVRDDVLKMADDLRQRVRDVAPAANAETRDEIERGSRRSPRGPAGCQSPRSTSRTPSPARASSVAFNGAMFQALRDTARRPGVGGDWLCVARGGKDGRDGKPIVFRGGFDTCDAYAEGDLVACEGQTFIATCDSPTGIPSDGKGWALFAARGAKGDPARRGCGDIKAIEGRPAPSQCNGG